MQAGRSVRNKKLPGIRTILLIALFAVGANYLFGQHGLSIKLYQNTDIYPIRYTDVTSEEVAKQVKTNFSRISIALVLRTKKSSVHELEFLVPEFSKPIDNLKFPLNYQYWKGYKYVGTGNSYSLRYEFSKVLVDHSERFDFLIGAGINPYYVHLEYEPYSHHEYYRSSMLYGFTVNLTPRIWYQLNQKFSIDLNTPISIYNFYGEKNRIDNPILPISQQRATNIDHLFFGPVYIIRLGLMYNLAKSKK